VWLQPFHTPDAAEVPEQAQDAQELAQEQAAVVAE
jgi:hypothetical protein